MAERDRVLERERRQMEQILELDMEELQVEEVDDDGSSSSSDVDTFLRNTHGDGGINTYEELSIDTSTVSLQDHTYLGAKVDGARGKFAFLHGDRVLNLPMFYLQGVVLFPEASLHLRVFQPRLVEAIDKAINHVDAPCMIGVYVYRHTNDGHYTIASVGTMAEVWFLSYLITSYVMCTFGLPPC
ncbi:ATP-dependent protease La (LON) domain protein [Zea mays]|uniref:ATP-dependent protease La (LON) domain protein n=1 Tax=Zea mays TaxID=4577 RepID=A0A1D6NCV2_MAIZE|nr:ATP-dependent protease La (LON) domain protein [Zea mays]